MDKIQVTPAGTPVCGMCGGHEFIFGARGLGALLGIRSEPKLLTCKTCATSYLPQEDGPYSEAAVETSIQDVSPAVGRYAIDPVGIGLALVGAVALLLGVFLPRVEASTFGRIQENTLIQSGDGYWFIIAAVGTAAATYRAWQTGRRSWAVIVLGLLSAGLALYSARRRPKEGRRE